MSCGIVIANGTPGCSTERQAFSPTQGQLRPEIEPPQKRLTISFVSYELQSMRLSETWRVVAGCLPAAVPSGADGEQNMAKFLAAAPTRLNRDMASRISWRHRARHTIIRDLESSITLLHELRHKAKANENEPSP